MQRKLVFSLRIAAVIAVISSIAFFAPVKALYVYLMPLSNNVQSEVNRAVDAGLTGVIVYISRPGAQADRAYAAGIDNLKRKQPASAGALFKIGRISKLYLAAAVTRLVAQKKLDLNKTLLDYLPQLAKRVTNADKVTLRMLVQHRSGIVDFTDDPTFPWLAPFDEEEDTIKSMAMIYDKPANFAPDEAYEYANSNYLLIARIIDNVVPGNHQTYITSQFIQPLGLTHTYPTVKHVDSDRLMSGYIAGYQDDLKPLAFINPAGAMVSSAQDVAVFLRALNSGTLLNEQEQKLYSSLYFNSHDGWLPGYLSFARYFEDSDTVIVLFTNNSGDEAWMIADFTIDRIHDVTNAL